jgi:hypothetical protein
MEKKKIHYCFILSEEQMKFLRSKKYKIDRMECFMSLIALAECEPKLVQVSKTQQVEILRGQLMVDNTLLAKLWNKDRKTVPKILEAMESLGISSSQKVGENRVHTLHSLSGWYVDGTLITNPFGIRRSSDGSGIFHTEVSPVSNSMSHLSSQSNDSADEGKSGDDADSSICSSTPSSSRSESHFNYAVSSSSSEGADGNQNEGKGKENEDVPQQPGGQSSQINGNPKGNNKPYGSNIPNGYHS